MSEIQKNEIAWRKLVGAVVLAVLVGLPLFYIFGYEWKDHSYRFNYSIDIEKSGSGNFTMIVPFPAFNQGDSHWNERILEQLRTQSGPELDLVETENGLGLEIRSTESCEMMVDYEIDVPASFLTLDNDTSEALWRFYWVFAHFQDGTDLEVDVVMENIHSYSWKRAGDIGSWGGGGGPCIWLDIEPGDVLQGWNQYEGVNTSLEIN